MPEHGNNEVSLHLVRLGTLPRIEHAGKGHPVG